MMHRLHAIPRHHRDSFALTAITGAIGITYAATGHPRLAFAAMGLMFTAALASFIGGRRKRASARTWRS